MVDYKQELTEIGIEVKDLNLIRDKDNIRVYSVSFDGKLAVLKVIDNPSALKEIEYYKVLHSIGVPTIEVYALTKHCILMEDLNVSQRYRLATKEDMNDPRVMSALGTWYETLHHKSKAWVRDNNFKSNDGMIQLLRGVDIDALKQWVGGNRATFFELLEANRKILLKYLENQELVLCYNDFYFENMAVSHDKSQALMFDYSMMAPNSVEADLINALWFSSDASRHSFKQTYGLVDASKVNTMSLILSIITLIEAMKKNTKAQYVIDIIKDIASGKKTDELHQLLIDIKMKV